MITTEEIIQSEVRALTWKQPFASLMIYGKQETRVWDTKYRGLVLICAGKVMYKWPAVEAISGADNLARMMDLFKMGLHDGFSKLNHIQNDVLITGKAIAIGRLIGVKHMVDHYMPDDKKLIENITYVKWDDKLLIHEYEDVTPIRIIPWKGAQRWQILTPEQKLLIKPL